MDILPIGYLPVKNNYNNIVRIKNSHNKIIIKKIEGVRYIKKNKK